jgi:hypothetical protein
MRSDGRLSRENLGTIPSYPRRLGPHPAVLERAESPARRRPHLAPSLTRRAADFLGEPQVTVHRIGDSAAKQFHGGRAEIRSQRSARPGGQRFPRMHGRRSLLQGTMLSSSRPMLVGTNDHRPSASSNRPARRCRCSAMPRWFGRTCIPKCSERYSRTCSADALLPSVWTACSVASPSASAGCCRVRRSPRPTPRRRAVPSRSRPPAALARPGVTAPLGLLVLLPRPAKCPYRHIPHQIA